MQFAIHEVRFKPEQEIVTIAVQRVAGPFIGRQRDLIDLYTTQTALMERNAKGDTWGDEEVVAEASALLAAEGAALVPPNAGGANAR